MKILAMGPSGPAHELDPLREAGREAVISRPLDQSGRKAYTEAELIDQILAACRGEAPGHRVNPEAIPPWRVRR